MAQIEKGDFGYLIDGTDRIKLYMYLCLKYPFIVFCFYFSSVLEGN